MPYRGRRAGDTLWRRPAYLASIREPMTKGVVVVGAGFSGLAAAYELTQRGYRPIVLEADPTGRRPGGCPFRLMARASSASIIIGSLTITTSARSCTNSASKIGLSIGRRAPGCILPIGSIACRLRSTCCGFLFFRLPTGCGLASRSCGRAGSATGERSTIWAPPNGCASLAAETTFRVVWEPLLRNKFGPYADDVSAAWFWSKLQLRGGSRGARGEERLAYFRGGFAALADELVHRIVKRRRGGAADAAAVGLAIENGQVRGVASVRRHHSGRCRYSHPCTADRRATDKTACG